MRRLLLAMCAAFSAALVALTSAPPSYAEAPWFPANVGNATQVLSVVGTGGSDAKMDVWQRDANGLGTDRHRHTGHVGANGMVPQSHDGEMATPMGIFTLDFAFGTAAQPRRRPAVRPGRRATTGGTAT